VFHSLWRFVICSAHFWVRGSFEGVQGNRPPSLPRVFPTGFPEEVYNSYPAFRGREVESGPLQLCIPNCFDSSLVYLYTVGKVLTRASGLTRTIMHYFIILFKSICVLQDSVQGESNVRSMNNPEVGVMVYGIVQSMLTSIMMQYRLGVRLSLYSISSTCLTC